jgi:hypothetical protein
MSFFIQGTAHPITPLGSCRDFYRFVLWNLSVRITILSVRTMKTIGSYHNSIGPYSEIYRFVSHFYWAILWNLLVRITILSGRTVKSIGSHVQILLRNAISAVAVKKIYTFALHHGIINNFVIIHYHWPSVLRSLAGNNCWPLTWKALTSCHPLLWVIQH